MKKRSKFLGAVKGFVYKLGEHGVGYYPDALPSAALAAVTVSMFEFIELISCLPRLLPADHATLDAEDLPSAKRVWRARETDGKRSTAASRRKFAINHPPVPARRTWQDNPASHAPN